MSLPPVVHEYVLKRHAFPGEEIVEEQFVWRELPTATVQDGEVAVKVTYLSCDPSQRLWIDPVDGYLPCVQPGEVMRAAGCGVVVQSKNAGYNIGDMISGMFGWRDWFVGSF